MHSCNGIYEYFTARIYCNKDSEKYLKNIIIYKYHKIVHHLKL